MKNNNPLIIPRNHKVEEALNEAEQGNLKFFTQLVEILKKPYTKQSNIKDFQVPSNIKCYQTFCGT